MDRTRLGRTGLDVTVACLGSGGHSRLGRAGGASFEHAVGLVRTALDAGVDFLDTAGTYGTEDVIGAAVAGRRDSVVISSKNHMVRDQARYTENDYITGDEFIARVDASLGRLGTDYVDIMYVHGVVADQYAYCVDEILPALHRLRDQGKVRHLGISERFTHEPRHDTLVRALQDGYFDVVMIGLNLVNHTAVREALPLAVAKDIGVQAIYAVRGKLADRERARGLVADAIAHGEVDPAAIDADDPLGFLVQPGVADSLVDACYRYVRHVPGVDAVVTGTGKADHLLDNLRSINGPPLPAAVLERVADLFDRVESVTAE